MNSYGRTWLLWLWALAALLMPAGARGAAADHISVLAVKTQDIEFYNSVLNAFRQGLEARLGGKKLDITSVALTGDADRNITAVRAGMQKAPQLILTLGTNATRLVAEQHPTVPVLFSMILNPVSLGVARSLETPGGRFTGTTLLVSPGKQFDALLQVAPQTKRVGVLYTDGDSTSLALLDEARREAIALGVSLVPVAVAPGRDVDPAALERLAGRSDALWLIPDPASTGPQILTATLAVARAHKLPVLGASGATVRAGALLALSANLPDLGDAASEMAASLLQGADPGQMRVRGPRRTTLSINLPAAQAIGLTVPDSVLHLADEVIDQEAHEKDGH